MRGFAKRLKQERTRAGMTLREVEASTGIDPARLSRWENGIHGCSLDSLVTLARLYGVTTDWLLGLAPRRRRVTR